MSQINQMATPRQQQPCETRALRLQQEDHSCRIIHTRTKAYTNFNNAGFKLKPRDSRTYETICTSIRKPPLVGKKIDNHFNRLHTPAFFLGLNIEF